jgi:DNA-binding MarR family transcriptional regulator
MIHTNFTLELARIRKSLRGEFEARAAEVDITVPQFQVLRRLWERDGTLASVIAKDVCAANSTMTGVLDRLEAKGLIERRASADDRRAIEIWLTPAGKELETPLMAIIKSIDEKALKGFSAAQRKEFMQSLKQVGENLEA